MSRLSRVSLAIDLDYDYVPFSEFYITAPRMVGTRLAREYIHEVLHFWQVFSSGFIANLALEEWGVLQDFEAGHALTWAAMADSYIAVDNRVGFSVHDLTESVTRFWDAHICNPVYLLREERERTAQRNQLMPVRTDSRLEALEMLLQRDDLLEREDTTVPDFGPAEQEKLLTHFGSEIDLDAIARRHIKRYTSLAFDVFMALGDSYSVPYLLQEKVGTKATVLLFPIVAHFSLQTRNPTYTYHTAIDGIMNAGIKLPEGTLDIHEGWRNVFGLLVDWCAALSKGSFLTPGWDVIRRSSLREHPVFGHYLQVFDILC
jgi:hypothetical protein